MSTNPDNVDGLPELPEPAAILERTWRGSYFVGKTRSLEPVDITDEHPVFTADQMRAYGELCRAPDVEMAKRWRELYETAQAALDKELCRAAPAGGDARTVPFSDWMEAQHELGELRTMLARSAPAGSGEVEFRQGDRIVWTSVHGTKFPGEITKVNRREVCYNIQLDDGCNVTGAPTHCIALLRKLQQGAE